VIFEEPTEEGLRHFSVEGTLCLKMSGFIFQRSPLIFSIIIKAVRQGRGDDKNVWQKTGITFILDANAQFANDYG
jgi:hypothetical protein